MKMGNRNIATVTHGSSGPIEVRRVSLVVGDADELLSDVATVEESYERLGRALEPLGDVLDVGERAVPDVRQHPRLVLRVEVLVVGLDEPLQAEALGDDGGEVAHGVLLPVRQVVLRDEPADGDPSVHAHVEQDGVEHGAADVLEVDVDAVGEAALERGAEVGLLLVVEGVVEAEPGLEQLHLLPGPGAADDVAAGEPGELAHQLADGAGRGGHEHGLALLRRADLVEAHVRGEPRHAEDAGVVGQRHARPLPDPVVGDLGEEPGGGRRHDAVVLPAGDAPDEVPGREARVGGVDHARDAVACDGVARDEGGRVGLPQRARHLGPHVGVAGEVEVPDEDGPGRLGARQAEGNLGALEQLHVLLARISLHVLLEDHPPVRRRRRHRGLLVLGSIPLRLCFAVPCSAFLR
uniref:Uncharacterized protein n=1 Tax=Zea mays TaxID=4577 RepID=C0PDU0_MAIZE|nr:unknown [Zea mays]